MTLSLKKNLNIFTQTLIKNFHLQQIIQVSCQFITIIQKTSLIIQIFFSNTAADSQVYTRQNKFIQLPSKLELHNFMEDQNTMC